MGWRFSRSLFRTCPIRDCLSRAGNRGNQTRIQGHLVLDQMPLQLRNPSRDSACFKEGAHLSPLREAQFAEVSVSGRSVRVKSSMSCLIETAGGGV